MVSDTDIVTLALSKGRIFDETLPLLKAAGIEPTEDPEKSRKLGAVEYVRKPFRPEVLVARIREHLLVEDAPAS